MRSYYQSFLLITIFILGCGLGESASLPIELNREYNFQVTKRSKFFSPDRSNKIKFFPNGTYTRTEDTGIPFTFPNSKAIQITSLKGEWSFFEGELVLNDKEIVKYHCFTSSTEEEVDCDIPVEYIPLGRSEWFKDFKLDVKTEEYLLLKIPSYLLN